jgi:hypothetical protein
MAHALRRRVWWYAALAVALALTTLTARAAPSRAQPWSGCTSHNYFGAANGKYVSAELGYGGSLYGMLRARASSPGPWETFTICSDGTAEWIRSQANGRYVSAELGRTGVDKGMLRARATAVGPWERFEIGRFGNYRTLKSVHNGRYVSAELGYGGVRAGMLRARATSVGPWEKFVLICRAPPDQCPP